MIAKNNRRPHAPVRETRRQPQPLRAYERTEIHSRRTTEHDAKARDRSRLATQPAPPRRQTTSKRRCHQVVQEERRDARASDYGRAHCQRSEDSNQARGGKQKGGEGLQGEAGVREGRSPK